jgi:methylmalonyl-CoA/ethylmalonyl-CoA epimerase
MASAKNVSPSSPVGSSTGAGTGVPAAPVGILRIDHVGIAVADLDEAIDFYSRVFGMTCTHVEENAEQGVREAMLQVGPTADGGSLQLLAPLSPESTIAKFLDRSGPGMQQLAYTVSDVDATCAELRSRGVRLLYDEPRRGTAGSRINFVHPKDAGGVLVELVEPDRRTGTTNRH